MSHSYDRRIDVETLARVEGEGAMHVRVVDGEVTDVRLEIYEPPRFFEGFLRGRSYEEPIDITARICGICPVAYQTSAMNAIEQISGVDVGQAIRDLRRLLYCGEWIESHVLHVYLLHAPDFLGYQSAIDLAGAHADRVQQGLRLRKLGNAILEIVGGRAIHPINPKVGGFHRAPTEGELRALLDELRWAREAAVDMTRWVAGFDFPDLEVDVDLLATVAPDTYAIEDGTLATTSGLAFSPAEFTAHVREEHIEHSTALHSVLAATGATYLTGPMARFALSADRLSEAARAVAAEVGLTPDDRNPFRTIITRSVETVYAIDEAIRIISGYERPDVPAVEVTPQAGEGHGVSEAPRGVLYHRYVLDGDGLITEAQIVPPTAQNQRAIERDLWNFVAANLDLPDADLQWRCEQAIRNYDPCISCSTHFLTLDIDRH